ncbi:MAG: MurR/RpiR family transcriptional regulator [Actinomycetota bacterium]
MARVLVDIDNRIAAAANQLTPTELRIVSLLEDEPTAAAFLTVADLADRVATSPPSVVRFAAKLGFTGYGELQASARRDLTAQLGTPTARIKQKPHADPAAAAQGAALTALATTAALAETFDGMETTLLPAMAETIAATDGTVWLVASQTSSPVAHILAANLRLIRPGIRHLEGSTAAIAAEVVDCRPGDVVIAIDFSRYETTVSTTTRRLAAAGAVVVALTDGPLSPLAAVADRWVAITVPAVGPFDSALPVLAVVEALTAEVAALLRPTAAERLSRIEASWSAYNVFEQESP